MLKHYNLCRHEICQKCYTAELSGHQIKTLKVRKSCQSLLIIEQRKCNVKQCKTDQRWRMISLINRASERVCRALGWSTKYQLPMENWRLLLLQQHCNLEYSLAKKGRENFQRKKFWPLFYSSSGPLLPHQSEPAAFATRSWTNCTFSRFARHVVAQLCNLANFARIRNL